MEHTVSHSSRQNKIFSGLRILTKTTTTFEDPMVPQAGGMSVESGKEILSQAVWKTRHGRTPPRSKRNDAGRRSATPLSLPIDQPRLENLLQSILREVIENGF